MERALADQWMLVNLVLAAVPVALALALARHSHRRTPIWWAGAAAFVVFLPNAPYVLTDVIHLVPRLHTAHDVGDVVAALAEFGALCAAGVFCYGVCIALVRAGLRDNGLSRYATPVEVALHAGCAVGIFLGRVLRLNSWDVVTRPRLVLQYVRVPQMSSTVFVACTFVVLLAVAVSLRLPFVIRELRRTAH